MPQEIKKKQKRNENKYFRCSREQNLKVQEESKDKNESVLADNSNELN